MLIEQQQPYNKMLDDIFFFFLFLFLQTPLRLPVSTKIADDFSLYHLITEAKK